MHDLVLKLDEMGRPAWLGLMVISFILFWPLGLGVLAFLLWSGRMGNGWGCSLHSERRSRWQQRFAERWERGSAKASSYGFSSSGNAAFDEYREQTLKRLEDEQREFREFLERLRLAKDRSEFDQFMADRKNRPPQDRKPDEGDNRSGDGNRPSVQG
jgi:hypothetical protein